MYYHTKTFVRFCDDYFTNISKHCPYLYDLKWSSAEYIGACTLLFLKLHK